MSKIGIVDVGGGFRGIYADAVLDYCLEEGIGFDLGIGVSAGSANLASFVAGQLGRNYRFYTVYGLRSKYAGIGNLIRKGSFIDLDYVYGTLSNSTGEYPIDFKALKDNPMELVVVGTDAETGKAKYFDKSDVSFDNLDILKASSAIPAVCKPYFIDGVPYYDGALGDPVPLLKALDMGCDKVVVLLTKPRDTIRTPGSDIRFAKIIRKKYPNAAAEFMKRAEKYNKGVEIAKQLEREGRVLIIAPDDTCGVSTLTRKPDRLKALYAKGKEDAPQIHRFLV